MAILAKKIPMALLATGKGVWFAEESHLKYGTIAVKYLQYGIAGRAKKRNISRLIGLSDYLLK
jgi:hypothetical protein